MPMQVSDLRFLSERVADHTGVGTLQLLGSQSLHAYLSDPPDVVLLSLEADYLLSEDAPTALENQIKHKFGRNSAFHTEHGFYADVVRDNFACLPPRWQERVKVEPLANPTLSLCSLEPHDLAISKLYVGRSKDIEFLTFALDHNLITLPVLAERVAEFGDDLERRAKLGARLVTLPSKIANLRAEQEEERRMQAYNPEDDSDEFTINPHSL